MSDEAGSVSVSILGDLKPFEDALRAAEKRAADFVKRVEAVTGKAPIGGADTSDAQKSIDKITNMHKSLTRELIREGNAQAAETKRILAQQDRDQKAAVDKQIADRKRLAAAMLQDAREQAAINRRLAAEEAQREKTHFKADNNKRFLASQASYQLSDVISGLAMGQSPGMIATQQGGQIYDLFQRSGGIKPTLEAFGSALKFAVNPIFLATSAIAGLGLIAGTAAYKFDTMMRGLNNSTQLGGRSSGATAASLYGIASRQADLSTSTASDIVGTFASAGVDVGTIDRITGSVKKFSQATGQDASDAAKELASALADPAKGVDDLAKRMGGFDVVVVQNIKNLAAQGDKFGAQKALVEAIASEMDRAVIKLNSFTTGYEKFKKRISDTSTAIGGSVSGLLFGESDAQMLSNLEKQASRLRLLIDKPTGGNGYAQMRHDEAQIELADIKKKIDALRRARDAEKETAESEKNRADIQAKASIAKGLGYDVLGLAPKQDLINQAKAYDNLIQATGSVAAAAKAAGLSYDEFVAATYRTTVAADAAVSADEKTIAQHKAAIEMITARTDAEKTLAAQHAATAAAMNTTDDPERAKKFAADQITAARTAAAADALRVANDNAASAGMSGLPKTLADINAKYAEQIRLASGNEEAIRKLVAAREIEKSSAIKDATAGPIRDATLAINEQSAAIRIQAATFGAGAAAIAEATKRQELYNQYAREGVTITPELAAGIDGIAKAAGRAAKEEDELNKSQKKIISDADHLRDAGGGFMKTFLNDLARGKSAVEALKDAINSLMQKLLDRVEDNIIDMILGKKGSVPGGADDKSILGGIMGQILGKDKQASVDAVATGLPISILPSAKPDAGQARIDQAFGLLGLSGDRSKFSEELSNPDVTRKLFSMTKAEVGGQGAEAQQAFMESIFNRASSRGKSLDDVLSDRKYFPGTTFDRASSAYMSPDELSRYGDILGKVRGGSNVSRFATGNASGSVGFGGGPTTLLSGGEKFGIESADASWASRMQAMDPSKMAASAEALSKLQAGATESATKLTSLGTGATDVTQALTGSMGAVSGGGGGFGGLLGMLLSLFKFEDGGIMTSRGPMPLRRYADGGIANSPQLAMFGEGSGPEAYVPLKNGGIPVRISGPRQVGGGGFAQTNITVAGSTINIEGNADQKTLDIMREEMDRRDYRISKDLDKSFGNHQRAYSSLRAR